MSIPKVLDPNVITQAFVCENEDMQDVVGKNTSRILEMFGEKAVQVGLRTYDPLYGADNILKAIKGRVLLDAQKYIIDATTFTHEGLLILINLLRLNANPNDVALIAYSPARSYGEWLSKGISEIRSILGYPGNSRPSKKSHLIVLVGYEVERAGMLIDAYEPAIISLGFGSETESVSKELHKRNVQFHADLKEKISNVNEFSFSCINAIDAKHSIEKQVQKYKDHNIVLAPMNTKISSIGAALASFEDENIQLCYAQAQQYNKEEYSTPGDECIVFHLPDLFLV